MDRNLEIFVRRCAGESVRAIGAAFGVSGQRVDQIAKRTAARLAIGVEPTLAAGAGSWVVRRRLGVVTRGRA